MSKNPCFWYNIAIHARAVIVLGWSTPRATSLIARALSNNGCASAYFPCKKHSRAIYALQCDRVILASPQKDECRAATEQHFSTTARLLLSTCNIYRASRENSWKIRTALTCVLNNPAPEVATDLNNRALLLDAQVRAVTKFSENSCTIDRRSQRKFRRIILWWLFVAQQQGGGVVEAAGESHQNFPGVFPRPPFALVDSFLTTPAPLLATQGKYEEADPLYLRAIEIGEKTLGPDHPDLATRLNNRAWLLKKQVRAVRKFQENSCGAQ